MRCDFLAEYFGRRYFRRIIRKNPPGRARPLVLLCHGQGTFQTPSLLTYVHLPEFIKNMYDQAGDYRETTGSPSRRTWRLTLYKCSLISVECTNDAVYTCKWRLIRYTCSLISLKCINDQFSKWTCAFQKFRKFKKFCRIFKPNCAKKKFARNFAKGFSHYNKETLGNYRATIGDYRETTRSPSRRTTIRPYSATISAHL